MYEYLKHSTLLALTTSNILSGMRFRDLSRHGDVLFLGCKLFTIHNLTVQIKYFFFNYHFMYLN